MLGWLTGSTGLQNACAGLFYHIYVELHEADSMAGEDTSHIDEPPETPAHLFAVRAFKSAIFGTPRPPRGSPCHGQKGDEEEGKARGGDAPAAKVADGRTGWVEDGDNYKDGHGGGPAVNPRVAALASPAKGILLTPGTAATRRKNVSFRPIERTGKDVVRGDGRESADAEAKAAAAPNGEKQDVPRGSKPRHSTLTKTLIELSKQKSPEGNLLNSTTTTDTNAKNLEPSTSINLRPPNPSEFNPDTTLDLDQPRSRSGLHWKTEYDRYHKRSNREMKRIIKYGQNVKSYAAKRDAEATNLSEKLRRGAARPAEMEMKVARLEGELRDARAHGPKGESAATRHMETQTSEHPSLHTELDNLRRTAKAAEDQNARLEKENTALKASLARVKEEMMSYETRRQAREERMKKREVKEKAAREECEMKLAKLTAEHEALVWASIAPPVVDMKTEIQSIQREAGVQDVHSNEGLLANEPKSVIQKENVQPPQHRTQLSKPRPSPRKMRQQKPTTDIWTLSSPSNLENERPKSKEPSELAPSSVKRDVQRTLKEINQNLIPTQQSEANQSAKPNSSKPQFSRDHHGPTEQQPPSPNPRTHDPIAQTTSSYPTRTDQAPSPAKLPPPSTKPSHQPPTKAPPAITARSASLVSRPDASSRTSTMCSVGTSRLSTLPAERVSAAKERLARRRRGERKGGEVGGME